MVAGMRYGPFPKGEKIMRIDIAIPCAACGARQPVPAAKLKRMVERSGAENFQLEHKCPQCQHVTVLGKSFAEMVMRVAP
jgi:hypothetical protein